MEEAPTTPEEKKLFPPPGTVFILVYPPTVVVLAGVDEDAVAAVSTLENVISTPHTLTYPLSPQQHPSRWRNGCCCCCCADDEMPAALFC
jgi:hypothetical protein